MLIHAALRAPSLTTVGEIAREFNLSAEHLHKVAQKLAAHGYVETVRGRAGGLRLGKAPEQIRLGEIALVTESDFQMAPCMAPSEQLCPIYEHCVLHGALEQASRAYIAELDKWTLADLVKKKKPLLVALAANLAEIEPA
jgi:Rrf2 family nitric oxide-sensitive transcriptional repressor